MCHNKVNKFSLLMSEIQRQEKIVQWGCIFPAGVKTKSKSFCNPLSKQICERFSTSVTMTSADDKRHKIHSRNHNPWKIWYFYDLLKCRIKWEIICENVTLLRLRNIMSEVLMILNWHWQQFPPNLALILILIQCRHTFPERQNFRQKRIKEKSSQRVSFYDNTWRR